MSKLTESDIKEAAHSTWEAIAFDLLNEGDTVTRDDVVDHVLNHIYMYGNLDEEQMLEWHKMDFFTKIAILGSAFKDESYGW